MVGTPQNIVVVQYCGEKKLLRFVKKCQLRIFNLIPFTLKLDRFNKIQCITAIKNLIAACCYKLFMVIVLLKIIYVVYCAITCEIFSIYYVIFRMQVCPENYSRTDGIAIYCVLFRLKLAYSAFLWQLKFTASLILFACSCCIFFELSKKIGDEPCRIFTFVRALIWSDFPVVFRWFWTFRSQKGNLLGFYNDFLSWKQTNFILNCRSWCSKCQGNRWLSVWNCHC